MKIQKATKKDLRALFALESLVFLNEPFALSKASFSYHIKQNILFTLWEDDVLAGYILWLRRKNYYRLYSLAIHPDFQGKSFASKLLEYSFETLNDKEKFELEVRVSNTKAIKLYEKHSFTCKKILKEFYPYEDGLLFVRNSKR
jgi:ribosomal-protein-alanine N-acetyltransferase